MRACSKTSSTIRHVQLQNFAQQPFHNSFSFLFQLMCVNYSDLRERFRGTLALYLILNGFLITQLTYQSHHRVTHDPFLMDFFIHLCIPTEFLGIRVRISIQDFFDLTLFTKLFLRNNIQLFSTNH
uniref:Uncharacterized protein n=1 Tax=Brassica oleracea var. oleracea TaxID=109376 RepID=A0A0D3ALN0_BRAOL